MHIISAGRRASILRRFQKLTIKSFTYFICTVLTLQPMLVELAYAQEIIIDPSGNVGFAPTMQRTSRPQVVDIATPNTGGVSHNQYTRFDVTSKGVVLNNSQTATSSQLAGNIAGNANLTNGSAATIVNEVTSTNTSTLNGSVEVAGTRANVIIANPNGITCNGCNFINAGTGTLTTGVPVIDGGNVSLNVTQGAITIGRAGLNGSANNVSNINLIGRTVVVDGKVTAIDGITVQGGALTYDVTTSNKTATLTGTGTTPDFVVDGTAFGAMEAGRIQIIGNERGLGVRTLGAIQSTTGAVTIESQGDGIVRSVAAQGEVTLKANYGDLTIERDVTSATAGTFAYARHNVQTTDQTGIYGFTGVRVLGQNGNLTLNGDIQSGADIDLYSRRKLTFGAYGSATGEFKLCSLNEVDVDGATIIANQVDATSSGHTFTLNNTAVFSAHDFQINTGDFHLGKDVVVDGLTEAATSNLVVNATGAFHNGADLRRHKTATITYAGNLYNEAGGIIEETNLNLAFDREIHNAGILYGSDNLNLDVAALFNNDSGTILSKVVSINTTGLLENKGTITSEGNVTLTSADRITNEGHIQGIRAYLTAPVISNSGELRVKTDGQLTASTSLTNNGLLASLGTLHITTGSFENAGLASVETTLSILADTITNRETLTAGTSVSLRTTGTLTNLGQIASYGNAELFSDTLVENQGNILIDNVVDIRGPSFVNTGTDAVLRANIGRINTARIINAGKIYLVADFQRRRNIDYFENSGVFATAGKIELQGRDTNSRAVFKTGSVLISGLQPEDSNQDLLLGKSTLIKFSSLTLDGRISAGGNVTLYGPTSMLVGGAVQARQNLILMADTLTVGSDAKLYAEGRGLFKALTQFTNNGVISLGGSIELLKGFGSFRNNNLIAAASTRKFTVNGTFENTGAFQTTGHMYKDTWKWNRPGDVGWSFSSKYSGVKPGHIASKVSIRELRAYENQISARGDIKIVVGGSASFIGSRIVSQTGNISIEALNGGVNFVAAPGFWSYNYTHRTVKRRLFGFYKKTTTYQFESFEDIYKRSRLKAANGNITIASTGTNGDYASVLSAGTSFEAQNISISTPNGNISAGTYAEQSITESSSHSSTKIFWIVPFGRSDTSITDNILINYGNDFTADEILDIAAPNGTLSITGGSLTAQQVNLTAKKLLINAAINSTRHTFFSEKDNMITITTIQSGFDRETAVLPTITSTDTPVFNISGEVHIAGVRGATLNSQLLNIIGSRQYDSKLLGITSPEDVTSATEASAAIQDQYLRDFTLPGASDGEQFVYLDTLLNDYNATYHTISLRDHEWYDKQVRLNPAFKALLTVVATYITGGINFNIGNKFIQAGVQSGTANLIAGAAEGAITGNFDMDDILRGALLAGVSTTISGFLTENIDFGAGLSDQSPFVNDVRDHFTPAALVDRAGDAIINNGVSNLVHGQGFFDGLDQAGRTFLVSETMAIAQFGIGELGGGPDTQWEGSIGHLLLHGGVGCLALEALDGDCVSGFFSGASSSLLAGANLTDEQKADLAPLVGALAGYVFSSGEAVNVSFGSTVSQSAIVNNYLSHSDQYLLKNELENCFEETDGCSIEEQRVIALRWLRKSLQNDRVLAATCFDELCIDAILSSAANYSVAINEIQSISPTAASVLSNNNAYYVTNPAWEQLSRNVDFANGYSDYLNYQCNGLSSETCMENYRESYSGYLGDIETVESIQMLLALVTGTAVLAPEICAASPALCMGALVSDAVECAAGDNPLACAPGPQVMVPGRVQSRVNLESSGWRHVTGRHFDPNVNASQFTVSQSELRQILQSPQVVQTPVTRTLQSLDGIRYVREVNLGSPIGTDKFNGFQSTSIMTVLTDSFGNFVTATPGRIQ